MRYHGSRAAAAWTWSDPAARATRLHTRADGTGGELVEQWATAHGAATVDVIASAIGAEPADEAPDVHADTTAAPGAEASPGRRANTRQLLAAFWNEIDAGGAADLQGDDEGGATGHGAAGGDPHGRIGEDTRIGGTGPGGPKARAGGDHEGSETRGAVEGSRLGSSLGVEGGSEGGRFGGEGKPGDDGVRMAGAVAGGVIAIPEAIKGVVELMLLQYAGGEFPREQLPAKYREKGLKFKSTGYPDFEPYAMTLPNGKKTVRIELTGSRRADRLAANRAAGLERPPEGYTWHHVEDEGTMMLVPTELHESVAHSGGVASNRHRIGVDAYGD